MSARDDISEGSGIGTEIDAADDAVLQREVEGHLGVVAVKSCSPWTVPDEDGHGRMCCTVHAEPRLFDDVLRFARAT